MVGFSALANLAQDEEQVRLTAERSKQGGARQRFELLRGHLETLVQFMVASEFFKDPMLLVLPGIAILGV